METGSPNIDLIIKEVLDHLSLRTDIAVVYLFGSVVNGPHTSESDVDIGIIFSSDPEKMGVLSLQQDLADRLGVNVDLVNLAHAPVVLRMQVLRKGRKILDRNPSANASFIVRTLFEYDDFKRVIKPIEDNILKGRIYG